MLRKALLIAAVIGLAGSALPAAAATTKQEPKDVHWTFEGPLGRFDAEQLQRGYKVYHDVCSACHATGVNGAPKMGDHAAWGPRLAQGKETLYKDALNGKGNMPPKGGTTWPDATIRMTVDYMVSLNK